MIPVLVRFDDVTRIAFQAERTDGPLISIYLPASPDPWSGCVIFMTPDRVEQLDIPFLKHSASANAWAANRCIFSVSNHHWHKNN